MMDVGGLVLLKAGFDRDGYVILRQAVQHDEID